MNSRNHKYALLLVAAVAVSATGAMSQAFAVEQKISPQITMSKLILDE